MEFISWLLVIKINNGIQIVFGHTTLHTESQDWAYIYITPAVSFSYGLCSCNLSTINTYWGQITLAAFGLSNGQFQICTWNSSSKGANNASIDYIIVGY